MKTIALTEGTRWACAPYPWAAAQRLADSLGLPFVAAAVLAGRGLTDPVEARRFLECSADIPDPFLFEHMEGAVGTLAGVIAKGGRVVVHGDYDADGITATATMLLGLHEFGLEGEWYLPSRFNEGYGLSRTAVEAISAGGPGVLITVDCGVNYPDEVALARSAGFEVIVVDHHRPGPRLPDCHLIHDAVGRYPAGRLCGVGLALKLLHGLHVRLRGADPHVLPDALAPLLDLVAVGTIADLAPLTGENRYYVHEGLKLIGIGSRVGLRALSAVSGCTGVADSGVVAFRLAPRLNAAGRLADPSPPLRLLLTQDEKEAAVLAQTLHELNGARQDVERQIAEDAMRQVEAREDLPPIIVLEGAGWHEGVVGIVASRMVERYNRPTILLGVRDGVAKGSGRSVAAYDLMEGLEACHEHLTIYGGHTQAAGLTLPAAGVEAFRSAIERHAAETLAGRDLSPRFKADAVLRGEETNPDTALALAALGPFGLGNPRPRLLLVGAGLTQAETTRDGSHLRCQVELDGVKVRSIGFGMGGLVDEVKDEPNGHVVGAHFRLDSWQGSLRTELLLERIGRLSEDGKAEAPILEPDWTEWQRQPARPAAGPGPSREQSGGQLNGRGTGPFPPVGVRDLRDRQGRMTALAQVVAAGERTLVVGCSLTEMAKEVEAVLPVGDLLGEDVAYVGRTPLSRPGSPGSEARLVYAEWDALAQAPEFLEGQVHMVAMGPPYRTGHVELLRSAVARGLVVHLCYGEAEREASARLLRYFLHPRFAMVCVFRAWQTWSGRKGTDAEETEEERPHGRVQPDEALLLRSAQIGWEESRVVLDKARLCRAWAILTEAGLSRTRAQEVKLEATNVPAYREAEAEYEECVRLCRTL